MRVLALDTTSASGSVAIVDDDRVLAERNGDPTRSHAERLPGDVLIVLEAARCALSDIDVFGVAAGPGSFTGLRTGIATIQGLAFVTNRRVVAISALEALAEIAGQDLRAGARVGVWMDAHRREVFSALFEVDAPASVGAGRLLEIEPAAAGDPAQVLERWRAAGVMPQRIVGDGAVLYGDLLAGGPQGMAPSPLASVVGRMAATRARAGESIAPSALHPFYVRRPDVEMTREKLGRQP